MSYSQLWNYLCPFQPFVLGKKDVSVDVAIINDNVEVPNLSNATFESKVIELEVNRATMIFVPEG